MATKIKAATAAQVRTAMIKHPEADNGQIVAILTKAGIKPKMTQIYGQRSALRKVPKEPPTDELPSNPTSLRSMVVALERENAKLRSICALLLRD